MHFRDPKVWREGGYWWMVIGARDTSDTGQVLLYRGTSLRDWRRTGSSAVGSRRKLYVGMSGLFPLWRPSLADVLPAGDDARRIPVPQPLSERSFTGSLAAGAAFALSGAFEELDHGHDFYAPQSPVAEDGRRIIMAG